jgi:fibronectin type 3 domain-containing protein
MMFELINRQMAPRTALVVAALLSCAAPSWAQGALNACDLNADGTVNVIDVQLAINMDLGLLSCSATVDGAGVCNSDVVDKVVTAALGGTCVTSHNVVLNWTGSTSSNIAGYNVYRATTSGGPYTKLNTSTVVPTTYTDITVLSGQTYYYVATTVDTGGNESVYSNQALAPVPTP